MEASALVTSQAVPGTLFVVSTQLFFVGGMLFAGRAIWKWRAAAAPNYLRFERGFVMAALFVLVMGLVLLQRALQTAGDTVFADLGVTSFLIAAVLAFVAETLFLAGREWPYPTIVVHVMLAFLGQALFGLAIVQTGLLPAWIGWVTVAWNLAWPVILPIRRPSEIYYPWLHYAMPLLIGIALLVRG